MAGRAPVAETQPHNTLLLKSRESNDMTKFIAAVASTQALLFLSIVTIKIVQNTVLIGGIKKEIDVELGKSRACIPKSREGRRVVEG